LAFFLTWTIAGPGQVLLMTIISDPRSVKRGQSPNKPHTTDQGSVLVARIYNRVKFLNQKLSHLNTIICEEKQYFRYILYNPY